MSRRYPNVAELAVLMALSLTTPGFAAPVQAMVRPIHEQVVFRVETADRVLARATDSLLRMAHREMARRSGVYLSDTVRVVYVEGALDFDSLAGGHLPDWGAAVAISERRLIVLRSTSLPSIRQNLTELLRHELAHLHLDAVFHGRRPPRWMHEGYAQIMAHEWRQGDDWALTRAAVMGELLDLRDIDGVNSFLLGRANLAYAQSYRAMAYFLDHYGWSSLRLFADALGNGQDWDGAFEVAIGTDYAGFVAESTTDLRERYNIVSLLGDSMLSWIVVVGLFILAYLVKRQMSRTMVARWAEDDDESGDDTTQRYWNVRRLPPRPVNASVAGRFPFRVAGVSRTDREDDEGDDKEQH